jgi:hypothetical protein
LTILVASNVGGPVRTGSLSVTRNGRQVYSAEIKSGAMVRLPYGDYTVDFKAFGWKPVHKQIKVEKPEGLIVLGAIGEDLMEIRDVPVAITLKVSPSTSCSADSEMWAKLVGVFSDYSTQEKVGPYGITLFDSIDAGTYVVMIVDGKRVRAVQAVTTKSRVTVVPLTLLECN